MKICFRIFIFLSFFLSSVYIFAATEKTKESAATTIVSNSTTSGESDIVKPMTEAQFKAKISDLVNQRRAVSLQIYEERVALIQNDPALRILHKAILDLHEKMAKQLNNNTKLVPLIDKGNALNQQIQNLIVAYQHQQQVSK